MSRGGGATVNTTTYRVMEELMTDFVATSYSFAGQGPNPKLPFSQMRLKRCVCGKH